MLLEVALGGTLWDVLARGGTQWYRSVALSGAQCVPWWHLIAIGGAQLRSARNSMARSGALQHPVARAVRCRAVALSDVQLCGGTQ